MSLVISAPSLQDRVLGTLDDALRTLFAPPRAARPSPAMPVPEASLTAAERAASAALLRVNHAGEISAQGLYHGQALLARTPETRAQLRQAAAEEQDHLAWCADRLKELGGRPSVLDPAWYLGSFCIGLAAGAAGDRVSLGFVAETERQVEAHLADHLRRLPPGDLRSAAVLERMAEDEIHHGTMATLAGGADLPPVVRRLMSVGGGLLRRLALHL